MSHIDDASLSPLRRSNCWSRVARTRVHSSATHAVSCRTVECAARAMVSLDDFGQALKEAVEVYPPRPLPPPSDPFMWLSGLEDLVVTKERFQFLNVGER